MSNYPCIYIYYIGRVRLAEYIYWGALIRHIIFICLFYILLKRFYDLNVLVSNHINSIMQCYVWHKAYVHVHIPCRYSVHAL